MNWRDSIWVQTSITQWAFPMRSTQRGVHLSKRTTFLNVKLQRLRKLHHLQCITSSKYSTKLEKSLCVRDKAEDICWMSVVFGPDSVLDITKWAQEYFQKPLSGKHNPPCHLQMPTLSCKKEAICEHVPEAPPCSLGQGSFKMDCFKVEKCSMVRRVQI